MSQEVGEVGEISDSKGSKMADVFTRVAKPARPVDAVRKIRFWQKTRGGRLARMRSLWVDDASLMKKQVGTPTYCGILLAVKSQLG